MLGESFATIIAQVDEGEIKEKHVFSTQLY